MIIRTQSLTIMARREILWHYGTKLPQELFISSYHNSTTIENKLSHSLKVHTKPIATLKIKYK